MMLLVVQYIEHRAHRAHRAQRSIPPKLKADKMDGELFTSAFESVTFLKFCVYTTVELIIIILNISQVN